MNEKSVLAQIVDAINAEDICLLGRLFDDNPDQKTIFTPFAAQTWIGYAAQMGKLLSIKKLESLGLDINLGDGRDSRRPICSAAANDNYEVVRYFLSKRVDLDTDLAVRNPLFAAVVGNSMESIRLLLETDIDVSVRYDSNTMVNMDVIAFALMHGFNDGARLIAYARETDFTDAEKLLSVAERIAEINAYKRC